MVARFWSQSLVSTDTLSSPNRFAALPRFVSALSNFEGAVTRRIALESFNFRPVFVRYLWAGDLPSLREGYRD